MKISSSTILKLLSLAAAGCLAGCATNESSAPSASGGGVPSRYHAPDGRTVEIGRRSADQGGWSYKDPHLTRCWIADGFNFQGYDTLYIAPTQSTAKFQPDEAGPHDIAKANLPVELARVVKMSGVFANVVTSESEIKPGARVLKLENTIVEYSKGGGAARYWAGLYGAGQPVLRVEGKMTDGDKTPFTFEARRSGTSAGARLVGGFMKDEDVQIEDIRSMSIDLADFIAAINGKYQPK